MCCRRDHRDGDWHHPRDQRPRDGRSSGRARVPLRVHLDLDPARCVRAWRWQPSSPSPLAADTVSIAIMEAIDNAFVLAVPGAMDAGLDDAAVLGAGAWRVRARLRSGVLGQPGQHSAGQRLLSRLADGSQTPSSSAPNPSPVHGGARRSLPFLRICRDLGPVCDRMVCDAYHCSRTTVFAYI